MENYRSVSPMLLDLMSPQLIRVLVMHCNMTIKIITIMYEVWVGMRERGGISSKFWRGFLL